jgi:nucleoside-diphosphate-sugar epimerase
MRLLQDGHEVVGIDCLTDYYSREQKLGALDPLLDHRGFRWVTDDLLNPELDLVPLIDSSKAILHQAGQPGVRGSWGEGFAAYVDNNISATQRLLEAARTVPDLQFVYASSSSVYGNAPSWPCLETTVPLPFSPYGVTKLAAEHLVSLYSENYGLKSTSLRYFTVYGPGQRPDMAMHRFIRSSLFGDEVHLFGTGEQIRDFTFVDDVVEANLLAADLPRGQGVLNISGGGQATVNDVLRIIEDLTGRGLNLRRQVTPSGDVGRTGGSNQRAAERLGWTPRTELQAGLKQEVDWMTSFARAAVPIG